MTHKCIKVKRFSAFLTALAASAPCRELLCRNLLQSKINSLALKEKIENCNQGTIKTQKKQISMDGKLKEMLAQIQASIESLAYGGSPQELYAPIGYMMSLGGKRLRPLLALLGYQLFRADWQQVVRPALAIEVFHNFTLMHDDIMDKAPLRRGQATVHKKWNESIAILSGDVMLVNAYELLLEVAPDKLPLILKKFNRCAAEVCEGQQWDMNFEQLATVSEAEYIEMIRLKTAVLLGFSLELGAILADAPASQAALLKDFGDSMGIGFQLKDDLLDVYGEQSKVGKQVGGDIIANKKTYLLIEALHLAEGENRTQLQYWLSKNDFDSREKVEAVTAIYDRLQIKERTEQKIQHYFDKAFGLLARLEVPEAQKQNLLDFTHWLIARES
jgi:geranylgeranyl diphosphate synthase type II